MLQLVSALKGLTIEASDGQIGSVSDFLFDDRYWTTRWMVVHAGGWLTGRKLLIHPSAIDGADLKRKTVAVKLTKAQVEGSPDIQEDQPVSEQVEGRLYDYFGWSPYISSGFLEAGAVAMPVISPNDVEVGAHPDRADPHLHSADAVANCYVGAMNGEIGHIKDFLVDGATWKFRYLIVDTNNWWPGRQVLLSPISVKEVAWAEGRVKVSLTQEQVRTSPPWDPAAATDPDYEGQLRNHYGWPSDRR